MNNVENRITIKINPKKRNDLRSNNSNQAKGVNKNNIELTPIIGELSIKYLSFLINFKKKLFIIMKPKEQTPKNKSKPTRKDRKG